MGVYSSRVRTAEVVRRQLGKNNGKVKSNRQGQATAGQSAFSAHIDNRQIYVCSALCPSTDVMSSNVISKIDSFC